MEEAALRAPRVVTGGVGAGAEAGMLRGEAAPAAVGSQPGRGRSGRGESQPCGAVKAAISTGFTLPTGAGSAGLGHRLTQWDMVSGERMAACSRPVAVRGRRMARCACSLEVRVAGHRSGDQPEGSDRLGAWVLAQAPTRSGSVPLQHAASLAGLTHG